MSVGVLGLSMIFSDPLRRVRPSNDMPKTTWHPIASAPFDCDIELAVVEGADAHALVFRCRRGPYGWVNAASGKRIDIDPTHWREWQERAEGAP